MIAVWCWARHVCVQDLVPLERWHVEVLHLLIQQGNTWFEHLRDALQYMVTPKGMPRDMHLHPPESWQGPGQGSIQDKGWRALGLDLEAVVEEVIKEKRPITKYHGGQIERIFRRQSELWEHPSVKPALDRLDGHPVFGPIVKACREVWAGLAAVHREVNKGDANVHVVKATIDAFGKAQDVLAHHDTPKPCRHKAKFYDHALVGHVARDLEMLQPEGLSLVHFSSRPLEHGNKYLKQVHARMPEGGFAVAKMPKIAIMHRKLFALSKVGRRALYRSIAQEHAEDEAWAVQLQQDGTEEMDADSGSEPPSDMECEGDPQQEEMQGRYVTP